MLSNFSNFSFIYSLCMPLLHFFEWKKKKYYLKKKGGNQLCVRNMHHFVWFSLLHKKGYNLS